MGRRPVVEAVPTLDRRRTTSGRASEGALTSDRSPGRRAGDAAPTTLASASNPAPGGRKRRATKDGREPLVVYLEPATIKSLKMRALERDTTASAIVADAIERWFLSRS